MPNDRLVKQAWLALILVVPAFSIGIIMSLLIAPGRVGQTFFTLTKLWVLIIPVLWRLKIEKKSLTLPKVTKNQIILGLILGLLMFAVILIVYYFFGIKLIDVTEIRAKAAAVGLISPIIYLLGCCYWTFINSFLEECVWRGFVYRQCAIITPGISAIIIAALFFTLHHSIALIFYTQNWLIVILGSLGVFIAGVIWSICLRRSSFWSAYLSHILADLAIAIAGWHLLFSHSNNFTMS
jgi:uncharacterized protein